MASLKSSDKSLEKSKGYFFSNLAMGDQAQTFVIYIDKYPVHIDLPVASLLGYAVTGNLIRQQVKSFQQMPELPEIVYYNLEKQHSWLYFGASLKNSDSVSFNSEGQLLVNGDKCRLTCSTKASACEIM